MKPTQFTTHYGTKLTPLRFLADGFSGGRQLILCTVTIAGGVINLPIQRDDIVQQDQIELFFSGEVAAVESTTVEPTAVEPTAEGVASISIRDDDGIQLETVLLQGADRLVADLTNESTTRDRNS